MKIYTNVVVRSECRRQIKRANKKKRPVEIIPECLLAISNFYMLMDYYHYIKCHNPNCSGKKVKKLLKTTVYNAKYSRIMLNKIDEHKIRKGERYKACREFHPFRMGSWGESLDKLVILYKIVGFKCTKDVNSIKIELIRFGNHDF